MRKVNRRARAARPFTLFLPDFWAFWQPAAYIQPVLVQNKGETYRLNSPK